MIRQSDGKIGFRELIAFLLLTIAFKNADMTPLILFNQIKHSTWMMPIIAGLFLVGPLLILLSLLEKYKDKGLVQLNYAILGKYIGFVINISLFVMGLLAVSLFARNSADMLNALFFPRTPTFALLVFGVAVSYFIANRGLEVIGRVSWFFFPILLSVLTFLFLLIYRKITPAFIYPIWGPGIKTIIRESIGHNSLLIELFYITILYPFFRKRKEYKYGALIGGALSILILSLSFALYLMIFDYPSIEKIAYPFQSLTMFVGLGRFISNIEAYFMFFWVIGSTIRFAIYIYLLAAAFGYTLKLKEFEPLVLPMSAMIALIGILPINSIIAVLYWRSKYLQLGGSMFFIFLPLILWLVDYVKGKGVRDEKTG